MLPLIPHDKANHLAYGAAIACLCLAVDPFFSAAAVAVFAFGKEIFDHATGKGTPDIKDTLWTLLGGAFVLLPWFVPRWL